MVELVVEALTVSAGPARLVDQASLTVRSGELVAIVGENGAGKSTLLRAIAGYCPPVSGYCTIDGQTHAALTPRERARRLAWLPQTVPIAWPIKVRDAVALGRFPHGAAPAHMAHLDRRAVDQAMANCDLTGLADRSTATLSGGELARVHIARALASEAPILLADEPVAALDPRHQLAIMRLLRQSVDKGGATLVVLHDLGLAARFADRMIGMKQGRILIDALPEEVVSPHWIKQLFGVEATVNSEHGWPQPAIL